MDLQPNKFFHTLKIFYNANQLLMNRDKTVLLFLSQAGKSDSRDEICLMEEPKNIIPKLQLKILGWCIKQQLSYDTTVNMNAGIVMKNIRNLKEIIAVTDQKMKQMIPNTYLLLKILYRLPLMIGKKEKIKNSIQRTVMMIARQMQKEICFKELLISICKSIGWE